MPFNVQQIGGLIYVTYSIPGVDADEAPLDRVSSMSSRPTAASSGVLKAISSPPPGAWRSLLTDSAISPMRC